MKDISVFIDLLKKLSNTKGTIFVGLGNVLKSDDGVGAYIIEKLISKFGNELKNGIKLFNVGISLENYLNKIILLNPNNIIFFDAIKVMEDEDIKSLGKIIVLSKKDVQNFTFSTHNISLSTITDYLKLHKTNKHLEIYIVGIKGQNFNFGENMTQEIEYLANILIEQIIIWSTKNYNL